MSPRLLESSTPSQGTHLGTQPHLSALTCHAYVWVSLRDIYCPPFPLLCHLSLLDKCYPKLRALCTNATNATFVPGAPLTLHGPQSFGNEHLSSVIWKFFLSAKIAIQFGFTLEILVTKTLPPSTSAQLAFSCLPPGTAVPLGSLSAASAPSCPRSLTSVSAAYSISSLSLLVGSSLGQTSSAFSKPKPI